MAGTIILYDAYGEIAGHSKYESSTRKNVIITNWQKRYGPKFKDMTVVDNREPFKVIPEKGNKKKSVGLDTRKMNRNKNAPKSTKGGVVW